MNYIGVDRLDPFYTRVCNVCDINVAKFSISIHNSTMLEVILCEDCFLEFISCCESLVNSEEEEQDNG